MQSLFICGCCGKNMRKDKDSIQKIILSGYANMLCDICRTRLENEVAGIAKKYLDGGIK